MSGLDEVFGAVDIKPQTRTSRVTCSPLQVRRRTVTECTELQILAYILPPFYLNHNLTTDHRSCQNVNPALSTNPPVASTFTFPLAKTSPFQTAAQDSGEWQNASIDFPLYSERKTPFCGLEPWTPNITEPGRGDSKPANALAKWSWFSSENKWKIFPT